MKKKIAFLIILLSVTVDQVVKIAVSSLMIKGTSINFIGDIIKLTYVGNTGVAYSMRKK